MVIKVLGVLAAGLSAGCWIRAAALGTPLLETYWDGPPENIAARLRAQWRWNAAAAWFAALASLLQVFG